MAGRRIAARPWSGLRLIAVVLALLALLWVAGRVLVLTPFGVAAAIVNTAFPLAAAAGLAVPLLRAKNRRNYFFVGLLVAMGVAQLSLHLAQLGVITLPGWVGVRLALDMMLFIMAVMGGRVIPMFTNNGVAGAAARRVRANRARARRRASAAPSARPRPRGARRRPARGAPPRWAPAPHVPSSARGERAASLALLQIRHVIVRGRAPRGPGLRLGLDDRGGRRGPAVIDQGAYQQAGQPRTQSLRSWEPLRLASCPTQGGAMHSVRTIEGDGGTVNHMQQPPAKASGSAGARSEPSCTPDEVKFHEESLPSA